jgi:hypothetical protein
MARAKEYGECSICGVEGRLSYEHVPPRRAFNNRSVVKMKLGEHILSLGAAEIGKGEILQKGLGEYTLCERCNNSTGSWYAADFVAWCYQGMDILRRTNGKPTLIYLNYLLPLRIIKQVITMFFTVSEGRIGKAYPYMRKFVLDKEKKYLPPDFRIFVYYSIEGRFRWTGNSLFVEFGENLGFNDCLELSFPPFGYYMSCNGASPPYKKQFEITHFANYSYNEFAVKEMYLPVLPTWSMIPGDYRSKNEVDESNRRSGFCL